MCVTRKGESLGLCVYAKSISYHDAEGLNTGREGLHFGCPVVWFAWEEITMKINCIADITECTGNLSNTRCTKSSKIQDLES